MSITAQYSLDLYRAAQHGDPHPPAPGRHDWRVIAELRDAARASGAPAGRRPRGLLARLRGRASGSSDSSSSHSSSPSGV
ncbi:hypothetical protein [Streptomyces sp. NBC_01304]|uniref:hypothetical protein n=1 Tax=Streptomyces sp. NBC_01304 TaxID=2903818 RepID=UPI002E0D8178|nr:hypothetical protein OG430_22280 [Streptomyces sp. NBC_01304]